MKHEPDPDDPTRCRVTDLLLTECSGCRGSDESFVNALLRTEREPVADYGEQDREPTPDEELAARTLRPIERDRFWLNTGDAPRRQIFRLGRTFRAHFDGPKCPACPKAVLAGELIAKTNMGYAHALCLEEK